MSSTLILERTSPSPKSAAALVGLACVLAIAAGTPAQAGPIENLRPGEWYEVPNSHLRTVVPIPTPCGDPANIMGAWSGGAYDPVGDRLLVWGGGHADYGGNEIYAFSMGTLSWSRIWGPSPNIPCATSQTCVNTYADGNPVARHTYNGLSFLPSQNKFWIIGGSLYCGPGNAGKDTWVFDMPTLRWQRKTDLPVPDWAPGLSMMSAYDPATGHVWLVSGANPLHEYDPVNDTWTLRGSNGIGSGMTGTIDTKRHKYVLVGIQGVIVFDLNASGTIPAQAWATTGATNLVGSTYPGIAYDPVSDRVIAWDGGATVYSLNMDTKVWTRLDPAGTNQVIPTLPVDSGIYGRFRYIPSKNAFVGVNRIDENVFIYKLSSGGGAPADSILPSAMYDLRPR